MSSVSSGPARRFFLRSGVAAGFLALLTFGCAGRGDVSGKVTYHGKPLVWGTVQMEGSDNLLRQGVINSDGTYVVRNLAAGEARVAVSSINPKSGDFQPIIKGTQKPPPPRPEVKGWFPIPQEYQDISKPKLTFTVKSGQNTWDIELK
jgi:hypothetical protein